MFTLQRFRIAKHETSLLCLNSVNVKATLDLLEIRFGTVRK